MSDDGTNAERDGDGDKQFGRARFSHEALMKLTKEAIDKIIESDPLFHGLSTDATVEEIRAQSAVAQGQAITLYLNRETLPRLSIVVPTHSTTVFDLKRAIRRYTELSLRRSKIKAKISWKHVWKTYDLCFNDTVLGDDDENIKNYGMSNKSELRYVKKFKRKQ